MSAVVLAASVAALAGCGSTARSRIPSTTTPAALKLQRSDLVFVSRGLRQIERSVQREVAASRAAWPTVANDLPRAIPMSVHKRIAAANAQARALSKPSFLGRSKDLTGPAAGIAGLYESFNALGRRGWKLIDTAAAGIDRGPPATARFLRANAGLYVSAVYDAHFDLAAIGKNLRRGYTRLGAGPAFGSGLTQHAVDELADAYGAAGALLQPHPRVTIGR